MKCFGDAIADAIAKGAEHGITVGIYRALNGKLTQSAREFLVGGDYRATSATQEGIRDAFVELGILENPWLGRPRVTEKGRKLINELEKAR